MFKIDNIYDESVNWQMSPSERTCLDSIVNSLDNGRYALEIGSYCGGSLRTLSQHFKKVYSCDISFSFIDNISQFKNVDFIEGDSKKTVPKLIEKINDFSEDIGLIIIDADHEYNGVYNDIKNILKIKPKKDIIVLIHDSWYPPSRQAILETDWIENENISFIDIDFCIGDLMPSNMTIGGLAMVMISSEKREGDLQIRKSHNHMYRKLNNL